MASRAFDSPWLSSEWQPLDLTEPEPEAADLADASAPTPRKETKNMADRYTPEQRERLRELNSLYGEHGHRVVSDGPTTTVWARDPGPDVKRAEKTKQYLSRQHQGETTNPLDSLSDDELMQRVEGGSVA